MTLKSHEVVAIRVRDGFVGDSYLYLNDPYEF